MSDALWKWHAASVQGFDHKESALPCQDSHAVRTGLGDCVVAIVSDGAGSAAHSEYGSRLLCDELASSLLAAKEEVPAVNLALLESLKIRDWIERGIDSVRAKLVIEARASDGGLSDFHATVVGIIADRTGGAFFHIGDGAALAASSQDLGLFALSPAENGEYANETFFFTQEEWRSHLRIEKFGPEFDLLALMSDGVTPIALAKGGQSPFAPFLEPVSKFLTEADGDGGRAALTELLEREALRPISGDDKTLVWIKRSAHD